MTFCCCCCIAVVADEIGCRRDCQNVIQNADLPPIRIAGVDVYSNRSPFRVPSSEHLALGCKRQRTIRRPTTTKTTKLKGSIKNCQTKFLKETTILSNESFKIEQMKTHSSDRPKQELKIIDCGVVEVDDSVKNSVDTEAADIDEIDLDEDDIVEEELVDEEEEINDSKSLSKSDALKRRLRQLKQKVNQARQLNKQAVKDEGERSTVEGSSSARKKLAAKNKQGQNASWAQQNSKALSMASASGVDAKALTEQAADSIYKARVVAERAESKPHKYLRDLKSVHRVLDPSQNNDILTYNPLQNEVNPDKEREGARRLAEEMHKRVEKNTKRLLKRKEPEDGEVSYINKRNKLFNEKISRDYDKHTAEIRDSLERGSAL